MGFWSSFFGHAAANAYNEIKKNEKEMQKWNDLFHEMMECESAFNDYLNSVGINDSYVADVEHVNNGNISPIKREIESIRKKVNEYFSLGGQGENLFHLEDLDDEIETLKYLNKMGCVDRHEEFAGFGVVSAQYKLENDLQEERVAASLVKLDGNTSNTIVSEGDDLFIPDESSLRPMLINDINELSGVEFEKVCQQLVENMGFETKTTKASGDGGIDLIAYNHQPLLSGKYIIQCKRYSGSVGEPIIRDLYGVVTSERANKGILMTTGVFTKSANVFADGKPIELIDGVAMQSLLKQYGLLEKNFEEIKYEYIEETAQKLEKILDKLNEEEYDPYGFTTEEKQMIKEKEMSFEEKRMKENEQLLTTDGVISFKRALKKAEERDKYKVNTEIYKHYIDHVNCIFQIVTDYTTITKYDLKNNTIDTFKGTVFYFLYANNKIATIYDIVDRNISIALHIQSMQGINDIKFSMDIKSDFIIKSDVSKKEITVSTNALKIVLSLPYENDYNNVYDYLYILNNTNNVV